MELILPMILISIIIILLFIIAFLLQKKEPEEAIKIVKKNLPNNNYSDEEIFEELKKEIEKERGNNENIIAHKSRLTKTVYKNGKKISEEVFESPISTTINKSMSIINICPYCKKEISSNLTACPNCNCQIKKII